jgi:hypothetical protein
MLQQKDASPTEGGKRQFPFDCERLTMKYDILTALVTAGALLVGALAYFDILIK